MESLKSFLFLCGCPRSGTTAFWRLLVGDSRIRMGVERYGNRFYAREFINPNLFDKERFFEIREGDTFYRDLEGFNSYYTKAVDGYDDAVYFGDKIPKLYEYFERLDKNFPDAKTIFIFRNIFDVAASYKARQLDRNDNWNMGVTEAIADWNKAFASAAAYKGEMLLVDYERIFVNGKGLERLYRFLKLDVTAEVEVTLKNLLARSAELEKGRPRALTALEVKEICETADFDSYRKFCEQVKE